MSELPLIDMIAGSVIFLAMVRGIWIGMIREGLSLAAIGLCTIVTRLFLDPLTVQLTELTNGELTGRTATWIAGVLLVMITIVACGLLAKVMRHGAEFAGLGWADRVGGGVLGLTEGTIVAAILLLITLWMVGPDHPATEGSKGVEIVQDWQSAHADDLEKLGDRLPDVAAPGSWFDLEDE